MNNVIFLNTRPKGHQLSLNETSKLQMTTLDLPLMTIDLFEPEQLSGHAHLLLQQLLSGFFQVVVVVSVHAAQRLACYLQYYKKDVEFLSNTTVVAVGQATKHALVKLGIYAISPKDFALPMNNEGMLKLDVIANLTPKDNLLIIKGIGGRTLLRDVLTAKGVGVYALDSYQRKTPANLLQKFTQIQPLILNKRTFVLISSQFALNNWQTLDAKGEFVYLTLGDRLYHLAKKMYPNSPAVLLENLQSDYLETIITQYQTTPINEQCNKA